jgi:hypothetical protein
MGLVKLITDYAEGLFPVMNPMLDVVEANIARRVTFGASPLDLSIRRDSAITDDFREYLTGELGDAHACALVAAGVLEDVACYNHEFLDELIARVGDNYYEDYFDENLHYFIDHRYCLYSIFWIKLPGGAICLNAEFRAGEDSKNFSLAIPEAIVCHTEAEIVAALDLLFPFN